jgi:hypothetical protein
LYFVGAKTLQKTLRATFQIGCTYLAPLSNILGCKHSSIRRRLISVSLDLHSTCTKRRANLGTMYRIEVVQCVTHSKTQIQISVSRMLAFHTQYKDEDEYENKTLVSH